MSLNKLQQTDRVSNLAYFTALAALSLSLKPLGHLWHSDEAVFGGYLCRARSQRRVPNTAETNITVKYHWSNKEACSIPAFSDIGQLICTHKNTANNGLALHFWAPVEFPLCEEAKLLVSMCTFQQWRIYRCSTK